MPADNLIGAEGEGFRYILSGMNAERILIAAECIGDAKWVHRQGRVLCARERVVFGRPIAGRTRACSFRSPAPISACAPPRTDGARSGGSLRNRQGLRRRSQHGETPRRWKASWAAADMCVQTHGGFGFAEEFDIERKFRETRLYTVAPISRANLILSYIAEHVLGVAAVVLTVTLPLSGLLVVSLEQAVAAPMCTCRLADAGARVAQARTAGGRFRSATTNQFAHGECRLFRLAQPRQGIRSPRPC